MNTELQSRINIWLNDARNILDISGLNLKKWPDALVGKEHLIVKLNCSNNELTTLGEGLSNLKWLRCNHNKLTSIGKGPYLSNLVELDCSNNELTLLPGDLSNLKWLSCSNNKLTFLPNFLSDIIGINCSHNKLFSDDFFDWKKIWPLQRTYITTLQAGGIKRFIKTLKLRLYLPRLSQLHQELLFSPNHPGKFYKSYRWGNWSK